MSFFSGALFRMHKTVMDLAPIMERPVMRRTPAVDAFAKHFRQSFDNLKHLIEPQEQAVVRRIGHDPKRRHSQPGRLFHPILETPA
jgi:hypothetical protein